VLCIERKVVERHGRVEMYNGNYSFGFGNSCFVEKAIANQQN